MAKDDGKKTFAFTQIARFERCANEPKPSNVGKKYGGDDGGPSGLPNCFDSSNDRANPSSMHFVCRRFRDIGKLESSKRHQPAVSASDGSKSASAVDTEGIFLPTNENHDPAPGAAPQGMVWIPGGEFSMGANDPPDMNPMGMDATRDSRLPEPFVES